MKFNHNRMNEKPKSTFGKKPYKGKAKTKNRKGRKALSVGKKIDDLRLKPKAPKEPAYIRWFHEVYQPPCYVCDTFFGIQFHHIKERSTDERIDSIGMPLCEEHHLGVEFSAHGTPVKFKERYPMDVQYTSAAKMYKKFKDKL